MRVWVILLAGTLLGDVSGWAQMELRLGRSPSTHRLVERELPILDAGRQQADIACRVHTPKPRLGFDLRYHAEYRAQVALKDLAGAGNRLRLLMRVTPVGRPEGQLFLIQRFTVPPISADARGDASLPGYFIVGPGRYRVDWVLRDDRGRACSAHWEVEAKDDRNVALAIPPNTALARPQEIFRDTLLPEAEPERGPLHVKVLANFSPAERRASALKASDVEPIVSMLRQIANEPQFGRFSLVAFNMNEERVIYRQDYAERLDFPALGRAVSEVRIATIDFRQLQDPESGTRFLASLLSEHLGPQDPEPHAVVIVGPKLMLEKKVPEKMLAAAGRFDGPVFYLNYNLNPRRNPWRDAIGSVLKVYEGLEYAIHRPKDVSTALMDLRERLNQGR
jgi:hypothetical protein